jgi:hypothetical protein
MFGFPSERIKNNRTNQHVIDHTTPHIDRETTLKICFHSTVWIVMRPSMQVTCVVYSVMGKSSFIR